jgi:hypothetical protein
MNNKEELNRYITEIYQRKHVKTFKSDKGYDRVRDRKDKQLYEVDLEEEDGNHEER